MTDIRRASENIHRLRVGTSTNNMTVTKDGIVTFAGDGRFDKRLVIPIHCFSVGSTPPDQVILGDYIGYSYDIGDDSVVNIELPNDWATGTNVNFSVDFYINEAYATNSGEVQWQIDWSAIPHGGETVDSPTHTGTADTGDIPIPATAKDVYNITLAGLSGSYFSAKDIIGIKFSRIAIDDGSDPTEDPVIINMYMTYTANKFGEAV